jgi:hypothetical protein
MSQELLHDLEFCSDAPKERRIRMPESVPSNALLDAKFVLTKEHIALFARCGIPLPFRNLSDFEVRCWLRVR